MDDINIGQRIIDLRAINGISRAALAKKAGIALSFLNSLERNEKEATTGTLKKICAALGISLSDFFCLEDENQEKTTYDDKIKDLPADQRKIVDTIIEVNDSKGKQAAVIAGK
jgi:transcriptional regulator with XRE-family HTH domain